MRTIQALLTPLSIRAAAPLAILAGIAGCVALSVPLPARADSGDALVRLVNAYRSAPQVCQGRQMAPAAPLARHPALARVRLEPGTFLQHALQKAGYATDHAQVIEVSGPPDARAVMTTLEHQYCRALLSDRFSAMNYRRTGNDWLIVLAQPIAPLVLPELEEAGKAILQSVNVARATARHCGTQRFEAAPAVSLNAQLSNAALAHSRDMAEHRYFNHQGRDGRAVGDRARQAGYHWKRVGENIATNFGSPEDVVAGWLDSPGHCANVMAPAFRDMGAAYAVNAKGTVYWTQVFGAR